jgi:hypothetical protein
VAPHSAADVYWLLAALLPRQLPRVLALLACLVALAVELSRLIESPSLEAFRLTLAGKFLLGRILLPPQHHRLLGCHLRHRPD